jgi:hypothetical protein
VAERYWVGNTGMWTDTSHWSATSGGAGGASVPGPDDDVIIDESSFSLAGQYIMFPIVIVPTVLDIPVPSIAVKSVTVVNETPVSVDIDAMIIPVPSLSYTVKNYVQIGTCTITCPATPCVVTLTGHGCVDNDIVKFVPGNAGLIANEINNNYDYYVKRIDNDTFNLMVTADGEIMDTTGTQTATSIAMYKKV